MSDELERRLRAAHDALPAPADDDTAAARERFLAAAPVRQATRTGRRRALALGLALLAVAAAFGGGYAIASSDEEPASAPQQARLNAGPGFLPAPGWEIAATGELLTLQAPVAIASNLPLAAADRALHGPPAATARRLGRNGVLLWAVFYPAGATGSPQRLLPLRLADATVTGSFEGMPPVGSTRRLVARVGRYDVDVVILFGAEAPAPAVLAEAAQQLGRLVVPACPAALPLAAGDAARAEAFVLDWLRTHYQEDPADLAGARATATLGSAMPRGDAARVACGEQVRERTAEVDVVLPKLEQVSASLSQLSYFVSRTPGGWVVWQRIH